MSNELKSPSTEAPDEQRTDSVFDFLYYDANRVASLLSQFDRSGHLTGLTQSEAVDRRVGDASQIEAKGGWAPVAQAGGSKKWDNAEGTSRGSVRTYDPRWANALEFLDYADGHGIIQKDITSARIGQIVLFSGDLSIFDLSIFAGMWSKPAIKKALLKSLQQTGNPPGLNKHARDAARAQKQAALDEAEVAIELISILPHVTEAALTAADDSVSVWFTLGEAGMAVPTANLFLKHGLTVPGDWNVVGILDAQPEADEELHLYAAYQLMAGVRINTFTKELGANLVGPIRNILGRPTHSFGLTPLLLFREVGV